MKRLIAIVLLAAVLCCGCNKAPDTPAAPQTMQVPNFVGEVVYDILEDERYEQWSAWFVFAEYVQVESDQPVGTVLNQTPAAGEAALKGATVTLTVSKGGAPVVVPTVTGLSLGEAAELLERAGYVVQLDPVYDDEVEPGIVMEVTHEGESLPVGMTVTLTYSNGPKEDAE